MTARIGTATPETPEQMLARALVVLEGSVTPEAMLRTAGQWIAKWSRLVEEQESGVELDGRANIYTGETYAEARDRWIAYRGLLLDHLRGPDGGGH
jgi:hypothetical protein